MKIKILRLFGYGIIAIALSIFTSCEKDDAFEYQPYVRGEYTSWGYMRGHVTDLQTLERCEFNHVQHPAVPSRITGNDGRIFNPVMKKDIWNYTMSFKYNDKEAINHNAEERTEDMLPSGSFINLRLTGDLKEGVYEIIEGDELVDLDNGGFTYNPLSSVSIHIYEDISLSSNVDVKPVRYVPVWDEPVILVLDVVEYPYGHSLPLVEGHLYATLYREDNTKERLYVQMKFGK